MGAENLEQPNGSVRHNHLVDLFRPRLLVSSPLGVSDSVVVGWDPRIHMWNPFPDNAGAPRLGTPLGEPLI